MSVFGISGSSFLRTINPVNVQNKLQQFQSEFQQLGQDLQSGNLSKAQSDFAALKPSGSAGPPVEILNSTSNPIAQAFQQLARDLTSGNLAASQSDLASLQQDIQQKAAQGTQGHHHHHPHPPSSPQQSIANAAGSAIDLAFGQLGQALQTGSLPSAQQAYASLQQDFQQFAAQGLGSSSGSSSSSSGALGGINVTI
jgi:hypothetical protein